MKYIDRVCGRLKQSPEDFIVEEIGPGWKTSVSSEFIPFKSPSLDYLDLDSQREFLWAEFEKKDIDHFMAIQELARKLRKGIDAIGYAGTKDKVAWTSQRISIFRPDIEKIKEFSHEKLFLKNFKWEKRKIKLGYLEGNHFKIVIRDVSSKDASYISNKLRGTTHFPNYFGKQRFGSLRENNVAIGTLILKRRFEEAVWSILTEHSSHEKEEVQFARKRLAKEKDFREALHYFPRYLRLERSLLDYLSRNKTDFLGALAKGDRKTILLFVNAVQSKIFNEVLERALEEGIDFTKKGCESCLLMGYKTKFYDGFLGTIEKEILESHFLSLEDFDVRELPFLRIKGSFRKALVEVKDLELEIKDDELFNGSKKITINFTLPSGVYATTFLENFFDFV